MCKYKLIPSDNTYQNIKLYRIEALKDFSDVKKGDQGGLIDDATGLSQEDDSWIDDSSTCVVSMLFGTSKIIGSLIFDSSVENSKISNSNIYGSHISDSKISSARCVNSFAVRSEIKNETELNSVDCYDAKISGFCTLKNCIITKDLTDFSNIETKIGLIRAVSGMYPINGIYTFFQIEKRFLENPNIIFCSAKPDDKEYIAIDVHIDDIIEILGSDLEIKKYLRIHPVSGPSITSISKLDLIMED